MKSVTVLLGAASAIGLAAATHAQEITIATVNNGDMIIMQGLTDEFESAHPDISLNWVTLEENILRERVTTDIATQGGQYDVVTIGNYEVPIWAAQGWLAPLDDLPDDYNVDDLLPAIRAGLTYEDTLYAVPFYGESAITMYRTDLLDAAGMEMPESPTWSFIGEAARAMTDRDAGINGICLRGKAGWGENMGFINALANSYGARWFDMDWQPQLDSPEWKEALTFYVDLMQEAGPQGASSNGFNENLTLFQQGNCGMWMDASVAAGFVTGPDSTVADSVGFALFPTKEGVENHGNWLWSWNLAIPASSDATDAAKTFVAWATSQEYAALVAEKLGWASAPPGTRTSLYENPEYQEVASFAEITKSAMENADITDPSVQEVPYTGGQFIAIPEWQSIGTTIGQIFSSAVAGQTSVDDALAQAQAIATREMTRAGYIQ
jgi:sorbitol/mannitol transport system substrate-binding protein